MLLEYLSDILPDLPGLFFFDDQYINLHRLLTEVMLIFKCQLVRLVFQLNLNVCKKCRMPVNQTFSSCAVAIRQVVYMQFIAMRMTCRISNPFIHEQNVAASADTRVR